MGKMTRKWLSMVMILAVAFVMSFSVLSVNAFATEPENTGDTESLESVEISDSVEQEVTEAAEATETTEATEATEAIDASEPEPSAKLESTEISDKFGLDVYDNGVLKTTFSEGELWNIAINEGNGQRLAYDFSAFNANPSFKSYNEGCRLAHGPTVAGIIEAAGINLSDVSDNATIRIIGGDGTEFAFTKGQLLGNRYFYPNVNADTVIHKNNTIQSKAFDNAVKVPAIINMDTQDGTLMYGQRSPSEENYSAFCHYMVAQNEKDLNGEIRIERSQAGKWNPITGSNIKNNSWVATGTRIYFTTKGTNTLTNGYPKFWVYFTTSGKEPTMSSPMYNYNKYYLENNHDINKGVNYPIVSKVGRNTIKVKVFGYGKLDSSTTTLTYLGLPKAPTASAYSSTYSSNVVKWSKVDGAAGYRIYKYDSSSKSYKLKKIVGNTVTSYTDSGLSTGTAYYYRVRAYATAGDSVGIGPASAEKKATPYLRKPSTVSVTAGSRKATVKWTKVSGAYGYEVKRATSYSGSYTTAKTIKSGSTLSFVNKNLKKGKTYYFKVRAYRTVNSGTKYSSYSTIVRVKVK